MAWQSTPYTVPLLFAAAVSLALAVVAANRLRSGRRTRTTGALVFVALSTALYAGAYGLQLAVADLPGKLLLARVTWVGIAGLSVAWPTFVLVYAAGER
ncbi:histidine kinase N-terminal 7TM domain-containing protein, partial [Halobium palmae]